MVKPLVFSVPLILLLIYLQALSTASIASRNFLFGHSNSVSMAEWVQDNTSVQFNLVDEFSDLKRMSHHCLTLPLLWVSQKSFALSVLFGFSRYLTRRFSLFAEFLDSRFKRGAKVNDTGFVIAGFEIRSSPFQDMSYLPRKLGFRIYRLDS